MELSPDTHAFARRLRQRSLVTEVRDELERMILEGDLQGGERLNETDLAELLGVSRSPVREAARSLERDGLVRTVANKGVFVRDVSIVDALELYDLRSMIAGYVCECVAQTATHAIKTELRSYVTRMQDAAEQNDEKTYFALNIAFHDQIAILSGAARSAALYAGLGKEVRLMRLRVLSGQDALLHSNAEHERIVTAIEQGDADVARAEGAQHHLNGKKRLLETL